MIVASIDVADCTCDHPAACNHGCHGRHCDRTEHTCSIEFLPDDGGLTAWGCADCTPGARLPHHAECPAPVQVPAWISYRPAPVAST
jgi:hypothetical protein